MSLQVIVVGPAGWNLWVIGIVIHAGLKVKTVIHSPEYHLRYPNRGFHTYSWTFWCKMQTTSKHSSLLSINHLHGSLQEILLNEGGHWIGLPAWQTTKQICLQEYHEKRLNWFRVFLFREWSLEWRFWFPTPARFIPIYIYTKMSSGWEDNGAGVSQPRTK